MKARVEYLHTSGEEFRSLSRADQVALRKVLDTIAKDPLHGKRAGDVIRLDGYPGYWRLSLRGRRIVYHYDGTTIEVWFIEDRSLETYDRLEELPLPHKSYP